MVLEGEGKARTRQVQDEGALMAIIPSRMPPVAFAVLAALRVPLQVLLVLVV